MKRRANGRRMRRQNIGIAVVTCIFAVNTGWTITLAPKGRGSEATVPGAFRATASAEACVQSSTPGLERGRVCERLTFP